MGNPIKIKKNQLVGGAVITDNSKNIDIPAKKTIAMSMQAMFLNGEMGIDVGNNTIIRENGETKARIDNKYPRILVSKKILEKESVETVQKYMQEKDITSIEEIVKKQQATNKKSIKTSRQESIR